MPLSMHQNDRHVLLYNFIDDLFGQFGLKSELFIF